MVIELSESNLSLYAKERARAFDNAGVIAQQCLAAMYQALGVKCCLGL